MADEEAVKATLNEQEDAMAKLADELRREVHVSRTPWRRNLYIVAGVVLTVLGVAGLILPAMPGTPLLLLAAACFARGSERFYIWLLTNRWFGAYVRDWRSAKGIPLHIKLKVTVMLVLSFAVTILFIIPLLWVRILLIVVATGVLAYIWAQPTAADPRAGHKGFDD
jgi:uncharacterized protein